MPELIHIFGIILLVLIALILFYHIKRKGFDILSLFILIVVIFLLIMVSYKQPFYSLSTKLGFLRPFELFLTCPNTEEFLVSFTLPPYKGVICVIRR